ncbi:glycerophosphodiester phosphodiesterase family protein [Paratractidigestivibacter sp.]|uniref:glycerophosphodiester phosphodiesterase family protein n=1 Tax=Paratractidigestivibacter sp. TaxID=2847316 RepID=UPI002AC922A2|nr:glycerophosphodiester phosphodiesterase family protein [Paratractidigestivibacter sp.]
MKAGKILGAAAIVAGSAAAACAATCAALAPRRGNPVLDQQWREIARYRYAHRGLHGEGAPENSVAAFLRARDHGFGVELDVHLTADGELAVIHDSEIERMCGYAGVVEEMTMAELRECRLAGTDEQIPTFDEALAVYECDPTGETELAPPVIVELKTRGKNAAALCEKAMACLDNHLVRYCVESFDPRVLVWLRRHRPEVMRGQLAQNFLEEDWRPFHQRIGGTVLLGNAATRPDFVAYRFCDREGAPVRISCGLLGAHLVEWTICSAEDLARCEAEGAVPIFEGFLPA